MGIGAAQVAPQRQLHLGRRRLGHGHGHAQQRVGAETALVLGAVQIDQRPVDEELLGGFAAGQGVEDFAVHRIDGAEHALAAIPLGIAVALLDRLVGAGGSTGRNGGTADGTRLQRHVDFDGRIASTVQDFAGGDIDDGAHICPLSRKGDGACGRRALNSPAPGCIQHAKFNKS